MWNAETARRLATWYASSEGAFALAQENVMFQHLVSSWPRRGHTLLDAGCGTGVFLEMLWQYGFDVTGFDTNTESLDAARDRLGNKADFQLGQPDHLPFDDNSFDYVALLTILEYVEDPQAVLAEAIRVARRGVVIGFMNRFSAYALFECLGWRKNREERQGRWFSLWSLMRMARRICPQCRVASRSVLLGPPSTWRNSRLWAPLNSVRSPLPFGAYVGVRLDTSPQIPLTPLFLKAKEHAMAVCSGLQPETSREGAFPASQQSSDKDTRRPPCTNHLLP